MQMSAQVRKQGLPILLIDDDLGLGQLLEDYLVPEGFDLTISPTGENGLELAQSHRYALAVLDVMLPGIDGFQVLERLRRVASLPVLMLTTRGSTSDRVQGLRKGADDYLPKPFEPSELLERIRSILRRVQPRAGRFQFIRVDDIQLDESARTVVRGAELISLTGSEFLLLQVLLSNPGKVLARDKLVQLILDREVTSNDRGIDTLVSNLRRKLGPSVTGTDRIRSSRGVGYVYAIAAQRDSL